MDDPVVSETDRRTFLESRLHDVRARIDRARDLAGRSDDVDLVVVTKTFPASDVDLLAALGVRDVGENRDQEAKVKKAETDAPDVRWHMIGRLQSNKVSSVARWADVVESVDRASLVVPLANAAGRADRVRPLGVLIQVSLDPPGADDRGGASSTEVLDIAGLVASQEHLRLEGVMAVAPHPDTGIDPLAAFGQLAEVAAEVRRRYPDARTISAGMSEDLEQAVACGATQVRIGGAILGHRPFVQ